MDSSSPHPITGAPFESPVPPGTGWPGDPAVADTPVARSALDVGNLAATSTTLGELQARVSVCRACPRLVAWRESVAREGRRAAFAEQPYWGRPGPSFGDPLAEVLLVGLAPAAHGANRTGRMFTGDPSGDFLFAALHRTGFASQPTAVAAGDGLELTGLRIVPAVRCAPPQNRPTPTERSTCSAWLRRDIEMAMPHLHTILCLGAIGWDAALGAVRALGWDVPAPKPRFGHAVEVTLATPESRPVRLVGSYHVSPRNTQTRRLTAAMFDAVLRSLRHSGAD